MINVYTHVILNKEKPENSKSVTFLLSACTDTPEAALRNAVQEYISSETDEVKEALRNARNTFGWEYAFSCIPDSLFEKHGLIRLKKNAVTAYVEDSEILYIPTFEEDV